VHEVWIFTKILSVNKLLWNISRAGFHPILMKKILKRIYKLIYGLTWGVDFHENLISQQTVVNISRAGFHPILIFKKMTKTRAKFHLLPQVKYEFHSTAFHWTCNFLMEVSAEFLHPATSISVDKYGKYGYKTHSRLYVKHIRHWDEFHENLRLLENFCIELMYETS
jgi:hypothetical protein